jgi:lipid-binding SYLF domain-containing protein
MKDSRNAIRALTLMLGLFATASWLVPSAAVAKSAAEERKEIQQVSAQTLKRLYKLHPSARGVVESAAGYGTFSNFGLKIFVMGGGKGKGVIVNNASGEKTYMKMVQVGGGVGIGGKKFRLVFAFQTTRALNEFINKGWEFGGAAEGSAMWADQGAALETAISVMPGVWVYQITETGLAADAMVKGTKYYKDSALN